MAIKNRLKEIMDERGLKQIWLADKIGIDRSTLSSVIANRKETNLETAMRIAHTLDLKMEDIFELVNGD